MNTPDTGLDLISRKIFVALLQQLEEQQLSGWRALFAKTTLWYYHSSFTLIPDLVPGIGYFDYFCLSQLSLWLCATNPDVVEKEHLDSFTTRYRDFVNKEEQPLLATDTAQE